MFHAAVAMAFVTAITTRHAFIADDAVAFRAANVAPFAQRRSALLATQLLILTDRCAAVCTVHTVPVREGDERAPGVIGSQQVGHDREEIKQTTLFQCVANRNVTIAFADAFILDVRVGNPIVTRRRVGIERDHP